MTVGSADSDFLSLICLFTLVQPGARHTNKKRVGVEGFFLMIRTFRSCVSSLFELAFHLLMLLFECCYLYKPGVVELMGDRIQSMQSDTNEAKCFGESAKRIICTNPGGQRGFPFG